MIWKRDEDTAVVGPDNFRSATGAWADEPEPPEPLEIRIRGLGNHCRATLSEPGTDAAVDLDRDDYRALNDLAIPLEECR